MIGSSLVGQSAEFGALCARARTLTLPHGVLLEGTTGIGKSHAARDLAMALLCSAPVEGDATAAGCGVCNACGKVVTGNHPDLHVVEPPEDKKGIPVDAVRAIRTTLELRPVEGRARVVLIDPGDALNEAGQNALLKTLEEPGEATFLLLTASRPERLLPTVRSRVSRYRLRPLSDAEVEARCPGLEGEGQDPDRRARAVAFARGSIGLAKQLCEMDLSALEDLFDAVISGRISAGIAASTAIQGAPEGRAATEGYARLVLRVAAAACRAGIAAGQMADTSPTALAPDRVDAYFPGPDPWVEAADAVLAAEQDLSLEISAHHALTEMFLCWSSAFVSRG